MLTLSYYLKYNLSYHEVSEIMADRGALVYHPTVYRSVQEYSQIIYCLWKKRNRSAGDSWLMDKSYSKVKGEWCYLYLAIYSSGLTLNIRLRKNRNTQLASAFFKRLIKQFGEPSDLVTDKALSLTYALNKLISKGLFNTTDHRTKKADTKPNQPTFYLLLWNHFIFYDTI